MVGVTTSYVRDVFPALLSYKTFKLLKFRLEFVVFDHSLMRHYAFIRSSGNVLPYNSICDDD